MSLCLLPLSEVEDQVGLEARFIGELTNEVGLCRADIKHELLPFALAHDELLPQLLQHIVQGFDARSDPFLFDFEVVDLSALVLGQLGASPLLIPDEEVFAGLASLIHLVQEVWHLAHLPG